MKPIVLFTALLALAIAAPSKDYTLEEIRALPALEYEVEQDEHGQYAFHYVTKEGTVVKEHAHFVPSEDGKEHFLEVEGIVSYIGDDGKTYVTKYHAGPHGNHVEAEHLPVPPQPIESEYKY